ncbi:MAG: MMPL family transporter [Acidobacteria bacterium]|nr:MMPL family transporter [Acidobacteriota bacterium]
MARSNQTRLLGSLAQWAAILLCVIMGTVLFAFVDLTPKVQADFFFSTDDPQLRASIRIEEEFGESPQVWVAARSKQLVSAQYLHRLHNLTEDLRRVKGVLEVKSLTHGPEEPGKALKEDPEEVYEDLLDSPFWTRLLLSPDRSATFVVMRLRGVSHEQTIEAIDRVLDRNSRPDFKLGASGVPYVSEHVRNRLTTDLRRFSISAFIAFAVLVTVLFRSAAVLVGTMVASLAACFGTFLMRALFGMETDILMPNLWTIAFVLTISHIVYLTTEFRRKARELGPERAMNETVRVIGPASAWSLAANLLGFATLIFVSAKPLRQFGISGVIAAVLAMASAYFLYLPFLRAAKPSESREHNIASRLEGFFTSRHGLIATAVLIAAFLLAPFAWRVDTDPALPSYFGGEDRIRSGIEAIDRSGGSSPLDLVVADAGGGTLDDDQSFERLMALQRGLEKHRDVGSVVSIALLMTETDRQWYSFLFSWETRLEHLDSPKQGRVGRTFLTDDRRHGRFILRMNEEARSRPREVVVNEIKEIVRKYRFKPVMVGGLYPLQGELSKLVEGSVVRGLGGLLACFFVIVFIVSRSIPTALAMTLCLAVTPFVVFGAVSLLKMPIDIISAPAANVALPLGIDEMIHLGYTVRRERKRSTGVWAAWRQSLAELWRPILASMLIVSSGFALFLLSSFPPTQRLGVLVCIGAAITDLVVLVVLPAVATFTRLRRQRLGAEL